MKEHLSRPSPLRLVCALAVTCALLSCGLTAFASEAAPLAKPIPAAIVSQPPTPDRALYPADVQVTENETGRQIIKTYILAEWESPTDIPCASFERDGFLYELADITQSKTSSTDTRPHVEAVELGTSSKDLNDILAQLAPTLEYQSEDGYTGVLTLDLSSVSCEAAGYKNSSYTVTATREYPHLSTNDLSLIPKSITENGRTLELDSVSWEVQHTINVDYEDIPDSYRAIAKYTTKASKSVVTGYLTTASYTGELAKTVTGDIVYTAYFIGTEQNPSPELPEAKAFPITGAGLAVLAVLLAALLGGGVVFFFLRYNVKIYGINADGSHELAAKVRVSVEKPIIDLTPLFSQTGNGLFRLEIDRLAAKRLNGKMLDVIYGPAKLQHKIAFEGNVYKIEVDFSRTTIKAIY